MNKLTIDKGLKVYAINDTEEVIYFNPLDADFAKKITDVMQQCQKVMEGVHTTENEDVNAMFEKLHKADADIRAAIDGAFDQPVCKKCFGDIRITALSNGFPLWLNFLLSVVDEIDANISETDKQTSERMRYYTGKYQKKYGKRK